MHFKGASVSPTELKKVKSKTFSGVQCRIAKYFSVATVLLPDDWHTCSPDSYHHCTNVLSDGIRDAFCFRVHYVKNCDFSRTAFHVNNLSVYYQNRNPFKSVFLTGLKPTNLSTLLQSLKRPQLRSLLLLSLNINT